jgi:hypothetical protein
MHIAERRHRSDWARCPPRLVAPDLFTTVDEEGCMPLHLSARGDHVGMIDVLADSVAARSTAQRTPLHEAAQRNCIAFARALLDRGVDIDAADEDGARR